MENINGAGLLHERLTEKILGAFYAVYAELGYGFLESVYEAALMQAIVDMGLLAVRQVPIDVWFRRNRIGVFRADIVVAESVIIEVKAVRELASSHESQLLNALRATNIEVGLLLNFGPRPRFKRLVFANVRKQVSVHIRPTQEPLTEECSLRGSVRSLKSVNHNSELHGLCGDSKGI